MKDRREELTHLVANLANAWNSHDVEAFVVLLHPEVTWDDPALPEPAHGRQEVRDFVVRLLRAFPDLEYTPVDIFHSDDEQECAVSWRMTGSNDGSLTPPGFAPTRSRISIEGVDLIEIRDGLAHRIRSHTDGLRLVEQLVRVRILKFAMSPRGWPLRLLQRGSAWWLRRHCDAVQVRVRPTRQR